MVVRHGEAFTISDRLTVWKDGKAVYRPTVHYAYCAADVAIASLNELRGRHTGKIRCPGVTPFRTVLSGADATAVARALLLWQEQVLGPA